MTSAGSRKSDVTTGVETPESRKSSSHSAGLLRWLVSGNWPAKPGALLLVSIGAGMLLCYLMLTFTLSRDTHGDLRPQIASATYTSPRNGLSFDFTTRIRSQCQAGVAGCVVVCNNDLAGDPDFGQGKTCQINYRCGKNPLQILRIAEGRREWIRCEYATPPSGDTRGELRPRITSATYASPRNGRSFDVTTRIRSQCQAGIAGCVAVCNNALAGDPDFGQGKTCEIHYRCGKNPPQTLQTLEGRREWIRCE
jgi:hypothetical protein